MAVASPPVSFGSPDVGTDVRDFLIGTPYEVLQSLRGLLLIATEKKYLQLLWNMLLVGACRMTAYFEEGWEKCVLTRKFLPLSSVR